MFAKVVNLFLGCCGHNPLLVLHVFARMLGPLGLASEQRCHFPHASLNNTKSTVREAMWFCGELFTEVGVSGHVNTGIVGFLGLRSSPTGVVGGVESVLKAGRIACTSERTLVSFDGSQRVVWGLGRESTQDLGDGKVQPAVLGLK